MGVKFALSESGEISVDLGEGERGLLAQVVRGLDGPAFDRDDPDDTDPGYARLHPPVYLGDDESSSEWWRLMGEQLEQARSEDRAVFDLVVGSGQTTISIGEAQSVLRVVNQVRLVYAARLGIDVSDDFDQLTEADEVVLWFLSFVVDELSEVLSGMLP